MPMLKLSGVVKDFKGLRAVNDVSVTIGENEIFAMIGPNGSGKTTMFNLISGVYTPTRGSIFFKDKNIVGLEPHLICKMGIGRTYQITKPFLKLTVLENVMIGGLNRTNSVNEAEKKAREVLSQMNLEEKANALGKDLTVPERKRLELARALATQPKLLLLDEVMSGLNPTELRELIVVLRNIADGGITLFIIEHIMHAVMTISHRILVLNHGEVITIGTPREITSNVNVIEAYLGEELDLA